MCSWRTPELQPPEKEYDGMLEQLDIHQMDSASLFALAQQKAEAEARLASEAVLQEIQRLKLERKDMVQRHREELAVIESTMQSLGMRILPSKKKPQRRKRTSQSGARTILLEIISAQPEISLQEIRHKVVDSGIEVKNLNQILAYLKRMNQIASSRRGFYCMPGEVSSMDAVSSHHEVSQTTSIA
jgi:hypothetical protein